MEREKGLQKKYADLQYQIKELQEQYKILQEELALNQANYGNESIGSEQVSSTTNGDVNTDIAETLTSLDDWINSTYSINQKLPKYWKIKSLTFCFYSLL